MSTCALDQTPSTILLGDFLLPTSPQFGHVQTSPEDSAMQLVRRELIERARVIKKQLRAFERTEGFQHLQSLLGDYESIQVSTSCLDPSLYITKDGFRLKTREAGDSSMETVFHKLHNHSLLQQFALTDPDISAILHTLQTAAVVSHSGDSWRDEIAASWPKKSYEEPTKNRTYDREFAHRVLDACASNVPIDRCHLTVQDPKFYYLPYPYRYADREIPPITEIRYFSLQNPSSASSEPSLTVNWQQLVCTNGFVSISSFNKPFQRTLAQASGVLRQPNWFAFSNGPRLLCEYESYDGACFNLLPVEDILEACDASKTDGKNTEFRFDGFSIVTENGTLTFAYHIPEMQDAVLKANSISEPIRALSILVEELSNLERVVIKKLPTSSKFYDTDLKFIDRILSHTGTLYLKPAAGTCQGKYIVRTHQENGNFVFQTDSLNTAAILSKAPDPAIGVFRQGINMATLISQKIKSFAPGFVSGSKTTRYVAKSEAEARRVLTKILMLSHYWIAEEEIPTTDLHNHKFEFRLIFLKPNSDDSEKHRLIGSYAKKSSRQVAGNIALGARGVPIHNALNDLLKSHGFSNREERRQKLKDMKKDLIHSTGAFLDQYLEAINVLDFKAVRLGKLNRESHLSEIASVDVIPSWNESAECFDWYFVEIQGADGIYVQVGIKGLKHSSRPQYDLAIRSSNRIKR